MSITKTDALFLSVGGFEAGAKVGGGFFRAMFRKVFGAAADNVPPNVVDNIVEVASDEAVAARGANTLGRVGPGAHAGESIAARSTARDFSAAERAEINRIGSNTGCHTCGTTSPGTKSGNFVPDHQPPSALNPPGGPQRLYPQCLTCSREQGLEIARMLNSGGGW